VTRCSSSRSDGGPCRAAAMPGRDRCIFHDPEAAERRQEGRREGGRIRSQPRATLPPERDRVVVASAKDVCKLLSDTIHEVRTGQLDPKIANAVGYLASVMVRALQAGELEDRMAALEAAVRSSSRGTASDPLNQRFSPNEAQE
jgi:hypothetical protein